MPWGEIFLGPVPWPSPPSRGGRLWVWPWLRIFIHLKSWLFKRQWLCYLSLSFWWSYKPHGIPLRGCAWKAAWAKSEWVLRRLYEYWHIVVESWWVWIPAIYFYLHERTYERRFFGTEVPHQGIGHECIRNHRVFWWKRVVDYLLILFYFNSKLIVSRPKKRKH